MKEQKIRSFAIGLCGGVIFVVALIGLVQVQLARAERNVELKAPASLKWEYCAIWSTGVEQKNYSGQLSVAYICYFSNDGCHGERVEVDGSNMDVALIRAETQLGLQGWELVGTGPRHYEDIGTTTTPNGAVTGNPFVLYFKRPKA